MFSLHFAKMCLTLPWSFNVILETHVPQSKMIEDDACHVSLLERSHAGPVPALEGPRVEIDV